jgi:hypothetical protein
MLNPERRLQPNLANIAARVIDGEAIILDVTRGAYYSMDGAGAVVWELITEGRPLGQIAGALAERFDGPEALIETELERLATELVREGLVFEANGNGKRTDPIPVHTGARDAFRAPVLHKYTDMGDLLALDPPMPELEEHTA